MLPTTSSVLILNHCSHHLINISLYGNTFYDAKKKLTPADVNSKVKILHI